MIPVEFAVAVEHPARTTLAIHPIPFDVRQMLSYRLVGMLPASGRDARFDDHALDVSATAANASPTDVVRSLRTTASCNAGRGSDGRRESWLGAWRHSAASDTDNISRTDSGFAAEHSQPSSEELLTVCLGAGLASP